MSRPPLWVVEPEEFAQAGGIACLRKHGREYFVALGKRGGEAMRRKWQESGPLYETGTARLTRDVWQWLRDEAARLDVPMAYILRHVVWLGLSTYAKHPFRRPRRRG